jgi:hypothetical protein
LEHRQLLSIFKHAKSSCQGKQLVDAERLAMGTSGLPTSVAQHVISIMDINGDGIVDFSEFAGPDHKWHDREPGAAAIWTAPNTDGGETEAAENTGEKEEAPAAAQPDSMPDSSAPVAAVSADENPAASTTEKSDEIAVEDGDKDGADKGTGETVTAAADADEGVATSGEKPLSFATIEEAALADRAHQIFRLARGVCGGEKVVSALELFNIKGLSADAVEYLLSGMDVTEDRLIDLDDLLHEDPSDPEDTSIASDNSTITDDANATVAESQDQSPQQDGDEAASADGHVLEVPPLAAVPTTSFIAAGYLASFVYLCLAGCTCMSAATCMRQTTVVFLVAAIGQTVLRMKKQIY